MKITQVRLGRISTPLRVPFKTALRTVNSVEDVIVELHTDTGAVGYGEAPPTGVITGDTTGAILGAIQDHIAPALLGRDLAVAAVWAGIATLAAYCRTPVKKLFLAGGFARYLDFGNAVACGMLPDCELEAVGNTSLGGAARLAGKVGPAVCRRGLRAGGVAAS